jgi:hypothetical protein
VAERFASRLDSARFPRLAALLESSDDVELRTELEELLTQRPGRSAPRFPVKVIAKLLREIRGETVEESVVVRDISESGMRVTFPSNLECGLFESCNARFLLRLAHGDEMRSVVVRASLVRVAKLGQNGANLAYRFEPLSDEARSVLREICAASSSPWNWQIRPRGNSVSG